PDAVARAAEVLGRSRSPLVWVGGGAVQAEAGGAVRLLAERLVAPVIASYSGRGLLPPDHPLLIGPPHLPPIGELWAEADVVLPADALEFLDTFASALPAEAVVLCDMCIPGYWLGAFHPVPGPRRLLYPMGWGTLGCAFPQALGASLAGTGPAVSVSGDGGFL